MATLFDMLSGAGAALDVPGSMVRDTLGGRNPFDQLATPFSWDNRLTGRDLLRAYGLAREEESGANAAGGFLAEVATDPLTWVGGGMLSRMLRGGAKSAATAGRGIASGARAAAPATGTIPGMRPATAFSIATPALGAYMLGDNMSVPPEEQEAWKNWLGMGLMAAPLAMAAGRGGKKLSDHLRAAKATNAPAAPTATAGMTELQKRVQDLWSQGRAATDIAQELTASGVKGMRGQLTWRSVETMAKKFPENVHKLREQSLAAGRVKASAELVPPWVTSSMTPEDVMIQGLARGVSAQNMAGLLNHMGFKQHTTAFTDTQLVYQALQKLGGNASSTAVRDFLTSKGQDPEVIARFTQMAGNNLKVKVSQIKKMIRDGNPPKMRPESRDMAFNLEGIRSAYRRIAKDPRTSEQLASVKKQLSRAENLPFSQEAIITQMGLSPGLRHEAMQLARPQQGVALSAENLKFIKDMQASGMDVDQMVKELRRAGIVSPTGGRFDKASLSKFLASEGGTDAGKGWLRDVAEGERVRPAGVAGLEEGTSFIAQIDKRAVDPKKINLRDMMTADAAFEQHYDHALNFARTKIYARGQDQLDIAMNALDDAFEYARRKYGSNAILHRDEAEKFVLDIVQAYAENYGRYMVQPGANLSEAVRTHRNLPEGTLRKPVSLNKPVAGAEGRLSELQDVVEGRMLDRVGQAERYVPTPPTAEEMRIWDQRVSQALDQITDPAVRARAEQWLNAQKHQHVRNAPGTMAPERTPAFPSQDEAMEQLLRQAMTEGLDVGDGQRIVIRVGDSRKPEELIGTAVGYQQKALEARGVDVPSEYRELRPTPEEAMRTREQVRAGVLPPTPNEDPAGLARYVLTKGLVDQGLTPAQADALIDVHLRQARLPVSQELTDAMEGFASRHRLPQAEPPVPREPLGGPERYVMGMGPLEGDWRPEGTLGGARLPERLAGRDVSQHVDKLRDVERSTRQRFAPGAAVDPQTVRQWVKSAWGDLRRMGIPEEQIGEMLRYLLVLLGLAGAGGAAAGRAYGGMDTADMQGPMPPYPSDVA